MAKNSIIPDKITFIACTFLQDVKQPSQQEICQGCTAPQRQVSPRGHYTMARTPVTETQGPLCPSLSSGQPFLARQSSRTQNKLVAGKGHKIYALRNYNYRIIRVQILTGNLE